MKTAKIGRNGVEITQLGFGGAPIGNLYSPVDDATAQAAVDCAWAGGVRYFDTAPHYGLGLSERRLGAALARRARDEFAISTKVGRLLVANPNPKGSDIDSAYAVPDDLMRQFDYSGPGVMRSIESSLERLQLDRIDIVYIHDPENHMEVAIREAAPALARLRDENVIGAIGVGMNYVDPLLRFVRECDIDVIMLAGRWTLVDRSGGPLLDACVERGVAVVAAAPFSSGLLATPWPSDDATFDYQPASAAVLARARAYAELCRRHGHVVPQVALQFPLRHSAVASVVAGMRNEQEALSDTRWMEEPVSRAVWEAVESADRTLMDNR